MSARRQRQWLVAIVVAYFLLGVSYALATPPLEASDEYKHYPLVQYVQTQGAFPVLDVADPGPWLQEGAQPPLYYFIMAGLTAPIATDDVALLRDLNRHAFIGNPNQIGNKNLILHEPAREAFPWQGSVLAIHLIRFASLVLGTGTLLLTFLLGRLLWDERVGLLAVALVAFNPMYLFVNAAVNNDSLAILLGSAGFWLLVRLWRDAPDPRQQWGRYVVLGVVLGLGMLTKLSLGGLLGLAGLALALRAWRRRDWRYFVLGGLLVALPAALLAAPWLWRNWQLYGDPTGLDAFIAVQGTREAPLTWQAWREEFGTFFRSFWGLFGGVNVAAPEPLYAAYNLLAVVAAAGFSFWWWRRRRSTPDGLWLFLAWPLILFLLLLRWTTIFHSFQGRLIFPAIGALASLAAVGLLAWLPRPWQWRGAAALATAGFVVALLLPWLTIRPAYAHPEPLATVPADAAFGPVIFDAPEGEIRLVGVEMTPRQSVRPGGEPVTVRLYWEAVDAVAADYLSAVSLLGRELSVVGGVNRHPAMGMVPTSRWRLGDIWRDDYRLFVREDAEAPSRLQVRAGLYDPATGRDLPMTGPEGAPLSLLVVGEARLEATERMAPPATVTDTDFGEDFNLWGYELAPQPASPGDAVELTLSWRARGAPDADYTVFVHLLDKAGEQVAVADGPPLAGDYPTSLWQDGDQMRDAHRIALPPDLAPGAYEIAVGLYDLDNGARLQRGDGGDAVRIPLTVVATP